LFTHLPGDERSLSRRRLRGTSADAWHDAPVEIPKRQRLDARNGVLRIRHPSRQFPTPADDDVTDAGGARTFQRYVDAGGERTLQIQGLNRAYCLAHADWRFEAGLSDTEARRP
jgi:hypothetical protein